MEWGTLITLIMSHDVDIEKAEEIAQDILCFCSEPTYDDFGE